MAEEHEHARPARRDQRVLFFLGGMRHGQSVGMFVVRGFAVHKQHVIVRAVARNVRQRELPDAGHPVALQRHPLPAVERAGDFDEHRHGAARHVGLPAKNLAERRRALGRLAFV